MLVITDMQEYLMLPTLVSKDDILAEFFRKGISTQKITIKMIKEFLNEFGIPYSEIETIRIIKKRGEERATQKAYIFNGGNMQKHLYNANVVANKEFAGNWDVNYAGEEGKIKNLYGEIAEMPDEEEDDEDFEYNNVGEYKLHIEEMREEQRRIEEHRENLQRENLQREQLLEEARVHRENLQRENLRREQLLEEARVQRENLRKRLRHAEIKRKLGG